jgi:hypothetical protein
MVVKPEPVRGARIGMRREAAMNTLVCAARRRLTTTSIDADPAKE